uniref:Uncharacterized protein n=1 Tax=Romanomermis culicivorax TaxID=13658 RepID=A0A915KGV9_ROMCU
MDKFFLKGFHPTTPTPSAMTQWLAFALQPPKSPRVAISPTNFALQSRPALTGKMTSLAT